MAFRQPTFAPAIRQPAAQDPRDNAATTISSPLHRELEQSQEWVLFPARSTSQNRSASTVQTPTAGLSRLSDFGSLDAKPRQDEGVPCETTNGSVDDDEDLDSLDEGLHAFQEASPIHRSGLFEPSRSILPRHDGLGTFPTAGPPLQEQLWHFEHPRKRSIEPDRQRRRSSVQRRIDAVEDHDVASIEAETRERIEKWRMEQSRVLLDDIERETRRRRTSVKSQRAETAPSTAGLEQIIKDSVAENSGDEATAGPLNASPPAIEDSESFWRRITRRVIRDFIGIDDNLLSVIFGESLPTERLDGHPPSGLGSSRSLRLDNSSPASASTGWEGRLLDRLSRELGILLQQITEHPGAFKTPFNPSTSDYAGMPVTVPTSSRSQPKPSTPTANAAASFDFRPTLQDASLPAQTSAANSIHAALWGIEEEPAPTTPEEDREYWEQTPDVRTVFHFLHNRFTPQRRPTTTSKPPLNIATTSTPDSLRRAAIIRQYHPLVSRAAASWEQRHGHARRHSLLRRRSGSSCASSLVGSARRMGLRRGSLGSSSRNYWDIVGSAVGSGVGGGGMGAWGEV
ncbi:MAG: hypothetical protein ALECFALPRED_002702 [Alectoria fallacina]|uniref:Uncharacterized protein n=1 Tax=Alectoria fallacina TaxID=1903189 RepID=A0A8H3IKG8_9LECA|nr:MAG: hypothetical protein ALECFALPRED_002702 [Alectoria fallacina]